MSTAVTVELARAFRENHDLLLATARTAMAENPDAPEGVTETDLEQLINGFQAVVLEDLEQTAARVRDVFIDDVVSVSVALGQSPGQLARSAAIYGVLLSHVLVERIEPDARDAALRWLARFWGAWSHDVVQRALERPQ